MNRQHTFSYSAFDGHITIERRGISFIELVIQHSNLIVSGYHVSVNDEVTGEPVPTSEIPASHTLTDEQREHARLISALRRVTEGAEHLIDELVRNGTAFTAHNKAAVVYGDAKQALLVLDEVLPVGSQR